MSTNYRFDIVFFRSYIIASHEKKTIEVMLIFFINIYAQSTIIFWVIEKVDIYNV